MADEDAIEISLPLMAGGFLGTKMENDGKGKAILFISHQAIPRPEENKPLGNKIRRLFFFQGLSDTQRNFISSSKGWALWSNTRSSICSGEVGCRCPIGSV